jgi:cytochrome P450
MILTQMINEVLRHHSVMQFIPRETPKNMKYKGKLQIVVCQSYIIYFLILDNHPQTLTICM